MKRKIFAAAMGLALLSPVAMAQTEATDTMSVEGMRSEIKALKAENAERDAREKNNAIWKRTKTFGIGMAYSNWKPNDCAAFSPNYGFMLNLTKTYYVHRNPIAGFLKFGIDATWFDVTYMNYEAAPDWLDMLGVGDGMNPPSAGDYPDYDDEPDNPNLGSHQIDVALGVGVSATFAPFYKFDSAINLLKGKVYCRFLPTYSMMLVSEPDDTRFNYAFVPYVTFGAQFSWKVLSLFVEGRWGRANYKVGGLDDEADYGDTDAGDIIKYDKISCKNYGIRFGIGLTY